MWFRRKRLPFVSQAPAEGGGVVPLRVARMTPEHVVWWHSHVQPIIDKDPTRADHGWNWILYAAVTTVAGTLMAQKPHGYTIGIEDLERDVFVPCALVQLLGRFPALQNHRKSSVYLWYMTTAPKEALLTIGDHPLTEAQIPKRLGSIAMDVALTHSVNHRRRGRLGLHADVEGGDFLLSWYERRGMAVLPAERRLPIGLRRLMQPSDGRYCYYTQDSGREASRQLDPLRPASEGAV